LTKIVYTNIYQQEIGVKIAVCTKESLLSTCFDNTGKYKFNWYRGPLNQKLVEQIIEATSFLEKDSPISQRVWHIMNNLYTLKTCSGGNLVGFRSFNGGYFDKCTDKTCLCWESWRKTQSKNMKEKNRSGVIKQAVLNKYGVETVSQVDFIRDKISVSNKKVKDRAIAKRKETMKAKYGVESGYQLESCRASIRQEFSIRGEEIRAKAVSTLQDRYGVDNPTKYFLFREKSKTTSQERYGVDNPLKSSEVRAKVAETNMERYGVDNPLKSSEVRAKVAETNMERYGDVHPTRNQKIRNQIISKVYSFYHPTKELSDERILELYSILDSKEWWAAQTRVSADIFLNEYFSSPRTRYMHLLKNRPDLLEGTISLPHHRVSEFLKSLSVEHENNTRRIITPLELDIYIPSHNLAIEINGIYWHSELSGGKDRHYHLNKTKQCESKGIQLLHFTDSEINDPKKFSIIQSMIQAKLGLLQYKIGARSCSIVRDIEKTKVVEFLNDNHIQGSCVFSSSVVLHHPDHGLLAVMTLGSPRYSKRNHDLEILRFAVKQNFSIPGAFSRLLKTIDPNKRIISYASRSYSDGNVYKKSGFEFLSESTPNYFYIAPEFIGLESRVKYQKHKLHKLLDTFDPEKTEWENMVENGYDRVWDCGNLVYHKIPTVSSS
jgi:hypothetical protein